MSLKNYFNIAQQVNSLSGLTGKQVGGQVESVGYHEEDIVKERRFIPRIDFSKPENFARYGLATEYYDSAIKRIYQTFPYDGSRRERLEWENESLDIDLYIYENLYPRTNGYIIFSANGWGTGNMADGYGSSSAREYIHLYGGPHGNPNGLTPYSTKFTGSNYYEPSKNRESNLKYDIASNGVSVEFWLKKREFLTSLTRKEVIFDLWNGQPSSSADYGRLRIQLTGATSGLNPFRVTLLSGTTGVYDLNVGASTFTSASVADDQWHHYGFTFKSASAGLQTRFYVDGELNNEVITGSGFQEVTGALQAYIGALIAAPSGSTALAGFGKMSGSLDEFRYWKTQRSSQGIGRYWFTQVGGGVNNDPTPFVDTAEDVNTLLGVYYKFNEGITGVTATDSTVLDYAGRVTNGTWTGYTTNSRNTGSAIVLSQAAIKEYKDPIIYSFHPAVVALSASLEISGSDYDASNNANIYNSLPQWIREEDEEGPQNAKYLLQIMSSYFDDLQLKTQALTSLRDVQYPSGTQKPLPYGERLLNSHGFVAPDLFLDADVLEKLADRSEFRVYEKTLFDIKNTIYQNIYNNLAYIYKTKGTEKSFRNLIRCFGIDDELVKINMYANDVEAEMRSNRKNVSVPDKFANFNTGDNGGATVFQYQNPSSTTNTVGYISGSGNLRNGYAFTLETDVYFPEKVDIATPGYQDTNTISCSLFGVHGNAGTSETTPRWPSHSGETDVVNFQVYAVRDELESSNVRFMLTGTSGVTTVVPRLQSSLYEDVYDNTQWNLAVRVRPESYPYTNVAGVTPTNYTVELHGIQVDSGVVLNEFTLTGSLASPGAGREYAFVTGSKRVFVGAHRTNYTGSIRERSDVKINACRYWLNYLDDGALAAHAYDTQNAGTPNPHFYAYPFNASASFGEIPEFETLMFNWEFSENTGSNALGQFTVTDEASGSNATATANNGWIGRMLNEQYAGLGYGFQASSTSAIDKDYVISARQTLPENVYSTEMVKVYNQQEQDVFTMDSRPLNYYFAFEKSLYQNISEEILNYFATLKDLNTLIGAPVNRYRHEYKGLKFLRQKFFATVANTQIDFDKFYEFYKWFDSALTVMLQQLVPASTDFAPNVRTMIESHVLERSKYQSKFPFLEDKTNPLFGSTWGTGNDATAMNSPDSFAAGTGLYANTAYFRRQIGSSNPIRTKEWSFIHSPPSQKQQDKAYWWKTEASRAKNPTLRGASSTTNNVRDELLRAIEKSRNIAADSPVRFGTEGSVTVGGVGFHPNKRTNFVMDATAPAGRLVPGTNLPVNIMLSFQDDVEQLIDTTDIYYPTLKQRLGFGINPDINRSANQGNKSSTKNRMDGNILAPFSLYSSSVKTGFNKEVIELYHSGVTITNLHHDIVHTNDVPLQGPFTEKYVGGWQYRHQHLNKFSPGNPGKNKLESRDTRPEGWMLKLGLCEAAVSRGSGALGIVGPQYPDATSPSESADRGYLFHRPKANLAREEYAKRPVNIRNIKMTTGSTIIGNYEKNYQVVQTVGRELNDPYFNDQSFNFAPYPETLATRGRFPLQLVTTGTATTSDSRPVIKSKITMTASVDQGWPFPGGVVLMGNQSSKMVTAKDQTLSLWLSCSQNTVNNSFVDGYRTLSQIIGWGGQINSPNTMCRRLEFQSQSLPANPTFVVHFERTTTDTTMEYLNFITSSGWHNITVVLDDNGTAGASSVTTYLNGVAVSPDSSQLGLGSLKSGSYSGFSYATKVFGANSISSGANDRTTTFVSGAIASIAFAESAINDIGEFVQVSGSTKDSYGRLTSKTVVGPKDPNTVAGLRHFYTASVVTGTLCFTDVLNPGVNTINPGGSFKSFVSSSMSTANVDAYGGGAVTYTWSGPPEGLGNPGGTLNYLLPSRTGSNSQHTVFVNRFAGSGYEVMSLGYMDPAHEALSIYNALPYHNLSIRNYGLSGSASIDTSVFDKTITIRDQINKLRGLDQRATLHCGQFGHDAAYGSVPASTYVTTPSWHKTNRNPSKRPVSGSGGYTTRNVYDNLYVQHQIPQSSQQYSWITASLQSGHTIFDLEAPSCTEAHSLSQLITSSDIGSFKTGSVGSSARYFGGDRNWAGTSSWIPVDFVGLSTVVVDPTNTSTHVLGATPVVDLLKYSASPLPPVYLSKNSYINSSIISGNAAVAAGRYVYTNVRAGIGSPGRGAVLNAILLNRNGPYGWPTWKQIRAGETKVARALRKANKIGTVLPPPKVPKMSYVYSGSTLVRSGLRGYVEGLKPTQFVDYVERPVASNARPIYFAFQDNTEDSDPSNNISLKVSYANNLGYFTNEGLNNRLNLGKPVDDYQPLKSVADFTRKSGLSVVANYKQRVYPAEINAYSNAVRSRPNYSIKNIWNNVRSVRSSEGGLTGSMGFATSSQSIWPMDGHNNYTATSSILGINDGAGELQPNYTRYVANPVDELAALDNTRRPGPCFATPLYMGSASATPRRNPVIAGDAVFTAHKQTGLVPYYESTTYAERMRAAAKDYSILPEFRVSEHMSTYITDKEGDFLSSIDNIFSLTGAEIPDSAEPNFYKVYSNSDFMKYFSVIDEDLQEQRSGDLTITRDKISLSCKAFLKLLPYKGFFPVERTLELATLFSQSIAKTMVAASTTTERLLPLVPYEIMFAPGLLYNTIKSGVAVSNFCVVNSKTGKTDTVIVSGGAGYASAPGRAYYQEPDGGLNIPMQDVARVNGQSSSFNHGFVINSVPFETLYRPENFFNRDRLGSLTGALPQFPTLYHTAPSQSISLTPANSYVLATAGGAAPGQMGVDLTTFQVDKLYSLAIDNFLCAASDIFVDKFSSFVSAREDNFGTVRSGSVYTMTVRMNRTAQGSLNTMGHPTKPDYRAFNMCRRESGFGQPIVGYYNSPSGFERASYAHVTPPYMQGLAEAQLVYTASYDGQPTLAEIFGNLKINYRRQQISGSQQYVSSSGYPYPFGSITLGASALSYGGFAPPNPGIMQLNASYNFLEAIPEIVSGTTQQKFRWLIQSKFETPVLNLHSASIPGGWAPQPPASYTFDGTSPSPADLKTEGLWTQYCRVPTKADEGVFVRIEDSRPLASTATDILSSPDTLSLAKLVGFPDAVPQRVGTVKKEFRWEEAVVAVPFEVVKNNRRFISMNEHKNSHAYHNLAAMMSKYNFPPRFDFTKFRTVDPILMYVFEFSADMSQQDLANIWQNLLPEIGTKFSTSEVIVEEKELLDLLLGEARDLQWMVFKVKKRVAVDFERQRRALETSNTASMPVYIREKYSYNWPYDYCSLVELAQIEEDVQWASRDVQSTGSTTIQFTPPNPGRMQISAAPMPPFLTNLIPNRKPQAIMPVQPKPLQEASRKPVATPPKFSVDGDRKPRKAKKLKATKAKARPKRMKKK